MSLAENVLVVFSDVKPMQNHYRMMNIERMASERKVLYHERSQAIAAHDRQRVFALGILMEDHSHDARLYPSVSPAEHVLENRTKETPTMSNNEQNPIKNSLAHAYNVMGPTAMAATCP